MSKDKDEIVVNMDGEEVTFDKEYWETIINGDPQPLDYPKPLRHYELFVEKPNSNVENTYYFLYNQIKHDMGFDIEKIVDTYAASQASSQFGHMQSRVSVQQNQISQYLRGISDMIKGLFQIVREVRIIDERLQFYDDTKDEENGRKDSSEIVLKGLWVDQVEGGAKNPSSVYGLAANVGFTILPDLFFRMRIKDIKKIDKKVDELKFNEKVKEILKRKLTQYYVWKEQTEKELRTRKGFMVKYMRQHYETIKLYINWIKPSLRYVKQMQQSGDLENDAQLVSSFETNIVEIEILSKKKINPKDDYYSVILVTLQHRTKPELNYHAQEYQHKGPTHTGRTVMNVRAYSWTSKEIEAYKKYKDEEALHLMGSIDESIQSALDSLGDELKKYLEDKGEKIEKEEVKKKKKVVHPGVLDPFVSVFKGFGEIGKSLMPANSGEDKKEKVDKHKKWKDESAKKTGEKGASGMAWLVYKNYKKANGMMTPW